MPTEDVFTSAFKKLREIFTFKTKRAFLDDLKGQIEDDEDIQEILRKPKAKLRYFAVTFDRRKNDMAFSYNYFDVLLVALDAISGGNGIYKPSNQMRALQWNGSRSDLLRVLRYFARHNHQVNFWRALVLPFPVPAAGHRIDTAIHKK